MSKRSQPLRNLLLGTFLMLGALIVGGFVLAWAVGVYESFFPRRSITTSVGFFGDGEPYLVKYDYLARNNSYTDLNGKPLGEKLELAERQAQEGIGGGNPATLPTPQKGDIGDSLRLPWSSRLISFADDKRPPTFWYLIHDGLPDGHAYFEGYNSETKRRIGYIGIRGFREDRVPADERFALRGGLGWQYAQIFGSGSQQAAQPSRSVSPTSAELKAFQPWEVLINSGQNVYKVDLAKRQVSTMLEQLQSPVLRMTSSYVYGPRYNTATSIAMRTADQVIFLHPDGETHTLSLPAELRSFGLEVIERSDGGFTVGASSPTYPRGGMHPEQVFIVDNAGSWGPPREVEVGSESISGPEPVGVFAVCPPVLTALATFVLQPYSLMEDWQADNWPDAIRKSWEEMGVYFLLSMFTGGVLTACCYWHQSRYAVGKADRLMWPVFVFLFGLPGWIGYRFHRRWPVVEPCPACQQQAPRDREACATCGREFPAPALRGTEVFA